MNTQAALVSSCAVGLLASSELEVMHMETMCRLPEWYPRPILWVCLPVEHLVIFSYVVFAVGSVMWSLWTIYLSNHLVVVSMIVALKGNGKDHVKGIE